MRQNSLDLCCIIAHSLSKSQKILKNSESLSIILSILLYEFLNISSQNNKKLNSLYAGSHLTFTIFLFIALALATAVIILLLLLSSVLFFIILGFYKINGARRRID